MTADTLRWAAALMRARSEAATSGPWTARKSTVPGICNVRLNGDAMWPSAWPDDAEHIASWHPAVALAVADWLDATAAGWPWDDEVTDYDGNPLTLAESVDSHALAVARAYLGQQS